MRILIIAPYFAPYIGVGAARITSLSEFLSNNGWDVIVVCFNPNSYKKTECKRWVPRNIRYIYFEKTYRWTDALWRSVQDILSSEKIDICMHTVGPFDFIKKIHNVKTKYDVPYIIDYRDPWLLDKCALDPNLSRLVKIKRRMYMFLNRPIEKRAINRSAGIVCVTEQNTRCVSEHYRLEDKAHTIWNGFETINYKQTPDFMKSTYSIIVAGKMASYNLQQAKNLVDVVDKFRDEGMDISIYHIGAKEENIITYCHNRCTHKNTYIFCGEKSYEETMGAVAESTICYIAYAHYYSVGTKVYDYIAENKPIIYSGVVPSELANFVCSFENGFVANDVTSLKCSIRKIIDENIDCLDNNITVDYSRNHQNKRYEILLKALAQDRR